MEIQRLIGRSLRGVVDFQALGERSVYVDCDVLQADGGTRCAAITGGFVALQQALSALVDAGDDRAAAARPVGRRDQRRDGRGAGPLRPRLQPRTRPPRWTRTS